MPVDLFSGSFKTPLHSWPLLTTNIVIFIEEKQSKREESSARLAGI
jgi:hypothetical protein